MGESLLKKDFKSSDVQRARNLVNGNYGAATKIQVGYERKTENHKEGDVWIENGKEWTIEDGVKVSVSKLQDARDYLKVPFTCPKCGKRMNGRFDAKMYKMHGICFDCVIRMEDDLKRAGLYEEYERHIMTGNIAGFVEDFTARIKDIEQNTKVTVSTEDGVLEDWGSISKETIKHLQEWRDILTEKLN